VFAIYIGGTLATATLKPMWFDELVTYHIAGQPDVRHLWSVMATGIEQTPPVYHLLVHAVNRLLGPGELATRLPAVVGMIVAIASVFLFVRAHMSAAAALVGAVIPVLSASGDYAYEGRAYGLLLGLAAVAGVCWQRLNRSGSPRRGLLLAGFAASLWMATATHYYAGLLLVPFALGQFVADRTHGSPDRAIWTMLALAPLALVPWLGLAEAGLPMRLWSSPHVSQVFDFYTNMLAPAAVPITVALVAVGSLSMVQRSPGEQRQAHLPAHELAFAVTLALLPVMGLTVAFLVTGVWTDRYAITAVLGLAILLAAALERSGTFTVRVVSLVALSTVLLREVSPIRQLAHPAAPPSIALANNDDDNLPIVVSSPLSYLQLWHYATPSLRDRLTYLLPPPEMGRANTGGSALSALSPFLPLRVVPFDHFVQTHSGFEVYGQPSWMMDHLLASGVVLKFERTGEEVLWKAEVAPTPEPPDAGALQEPATLSASGQPVARRSATTERRQ
jgi:mannosyltransferase